jgi:hypothetical protein
MKFLASCDAEDLSVTEDASWKTYKGAISAGCAALSKAVSLPMVLYFDLGIVDGISGSIRGHLLPPML